MKPVKEAEFERTYDAPLAAVWQAWTDPAILKQWWGPDNVSIPECTVDLRVGGRFYIVMEAGAAMGAYSGTRWPMEAQFTLIEHNAKLHYTAKAWTEGQEETTQIEQSAELSLSEEAGKTKLHLKVVITKIGPDAGGAIEGMHYGYNQQFDKLATLLSQ